jgi:hypothetical protein
MSGVHVTVLDSVAPAARLPAVREAPEESTQISTGLWQADRISFGILLMKQPVPVFPRDMDIDAPGSCFDTCEDRQQ